MHISLLYPTKPKSAGKHFFCFNEDSVDINLLKKQNKKTQISTQTHVSIKI